MSWGEITSYWHEIQTSGGGGGGTPGGSDTQVQFNDGGTFGGSAAFTFQKASGAVSGTGPWTLTPGADIVPLTVRAYGSGTNNILQWQKSDNGALGAITHDGRFSLTGASIATDGSGPALGVTATLPAVPSAPVAGIKATITSAGSAAQAQRGMSVSLAAGYTGVKQAAAIYADGSVASTGTNWPSLDAGSFGVYGNMAVGSNGLGVGLFGRAYSNSGSGDRVGVFGWSQANSSSSGKSFGVLGVATNTAAIKAGGAFIIAQPTDPLTYQAAIPLTALFASNGDIAAPIFTAFNGTTEVFRIGNGGYISGKSVKTYTNNTLTDVVSITVPNGEVVAGRFIYEILAKDATNTQLITGFYGFGAVATSTGTVTADGTDTLLAKPLTTGTFTNTVSTGTAANTLTIKVQPNSSLTTTVREIRWRVELTSNRTVTPQ